MGFEAGSWHRTLRRGLDLEPLSRSKGLWDLESGFGNGLPICLGASLIVWNGS
jgi:hypothetical protein